MSGQQQFAFGVPERDRVNQQRLAEMRGYTPARARREAHEAAMGRNQETYDRILAWASARRDFIVDELVAEWRCSPNHVAPRCTELVDLGRLEPTGEKRRTRAGKFAAVLRVKA